MSLISGWCIHLYNYIPLRDLNQKKVIVQSPKQNIFMKTSKRFVTFVLRSINLLYATELENISVLNLST
jgi:hypothetical protein